jgi:uncharacterized pyridoxamine 5'-phosphate oxidase family protein
MKNTNDVHAFLKANVFYPATVDKNGKPRVRPFGAVALWNDKLYICTNSEKNVSAELKSGYVEIAATNDKGEWIRISAKAVLDQNKDAQNQMFSENPQLKGLYAGRENLFEVFYLTDGTASLNTIAGEVLWSVEL